MIRRIHHSGIIVKDMERSLTFYRDVLGLALRYHIVTPISEVAFLTEGEQGEVHTTGPIDLQSSAVELIAREEPEGMQRGTGQIDHICLSVSNLDEMLTLLREQFIISDEQARTFNAAQSRIFFFKGPDGETVELWEDVYSKQD